MSDAMLPEDQRRIIEERAEEATEVARATAAVESAIPKVGFIDQGEIGKLYAITQQMDPEAKAKYPEAIRAKLLAHEAAKGTDKEQECPSPTDDEFQLALFIIKINAAPLTEEDVKTHVTGKAPVKEKKTRAKAEKPEAPSMGSFFGTSK